MSNWWVCWEGRQTPRNSLWTNNGRRKVGLSSHPLRGVEHFWCFLFYFCLSPKCDPLKPGSLKYQSYNLLISLWALDGGERKGTKILNLYFVKTMPNWKKFAFNIYIASKFHSTTHIEYLILGFLCCFFVLSSVSELLRPSSYWKLDFMFSLFSALPSFTVFTLAHWKTH